MPRKLRIQHCFTKELLLGTLADALGLTADDEPEIEIRNNSVVVTRNRRGPDDGA